MKNALLVLISLNFFIFVGCTNQISPPSQNTEINFVIKPKIGPQSILPGKYYLLSNSDSILINRLDFYISNLTVSNSQKQKESNTSVNLFSFSKSTNIVSLNSSSIPLSIDTFRFLVGLDDAINNSDPTKYEQSNPLGSGSNMYWTDWTKYRYIVFEGIIKSNGVEQSFIYHTGLQYKNLTTIVQTRAVMKDIKNELSLILNIDKIFYPTAGTPILYSSGETVTHSTASEAALSTKVALNFSRAFTID